MYKRHTAGVKDWFTVCVWPVSIAGWRAEHGSSDSLTSAMYNAGNRGNNNFDFSSQCCFVPECSRLLVCDNTESHFACFLPDKWFKTLFHHMFKRKDMQPHECNDRKGKQITGKNTCYITQTNGDLQLPRLTELPLWASSVVLLVLFEFEMSHYLI